jgi:hypothetical protein
MASKQTEHEHRPAAPAASPLPPELERLKAEIKREVMEEVVRHLRDTSLGLAQGKVHVLPERRSLLDTEGEAGAKVYEVTLENAPTARVRANNEGEAWTRYREKTGLTSSMYQPVIGEVKQ